MLGEQGRVQRLGPVNHYAMALQVAYGDVAVVGLRDGSLVHALAAMDAVDSVTVYESKKVYEPWAYDEKVEIIDECNPRMYLRDMAYDFLYVDTYEKIFDDDVVRDIECYGSENQIGEYWFRGFEFVLLSALANGQLSCHDLPSELGEYLEQLQSAEEARNAVEYSDTEYNAAVLNALAESCASSLDTVVFP